MESGYSVAGNSVESGHSVAGNVESGHSVAGRHVMRPLNLLITSCLIAAPAAAAPARPAAPAPARAAAVLKSISVVPASFKLVGPRAEQGLIVTGKYSDGSERDLTTQAVYAPGDPGVVTVAQHAARRMVRPKADGTAAVTITVRGAPPIRAEATVEQVEEPQPVSFRNEVVPALTKLGCSAGTCHGTPTGKGGFKLSLQGYAPDADYRAIVLEGSRRANKGDAGRSLLLLKPMVEMPHGGGKRLSREMPEFDILTRWIAEGLRDDPPETPELVKIEILPGRRDLELPAAKQQQISAIATYSDGTAVDVTRVSKLTTSDEDVATVTREGLVEAVKKGDVAVIVRYGHLLTSMRLTFLQDVPGFKWPETPQQNFIDRHVYDRLKLFQIPPSPLASDREFFRRAFVDALGAIPTADEVRAFAADASPDKRAKLIDALTLRPEFADYWALKWADVLRIQDETLLYKSSHAYHMWVRDSLAANKPMDQFVRELLTASGKTLQNPAANYFRVSQDPVVLSESTAQLFLGVRMACAKCHNHPFERWTQDEYYQLAAFFSQIEVQGEKGRAHEVTVNLDPEGEVTHLRTGKTMRPKLLGDAYPKIEPGKDRRVALAEWITRRDNPFFAKSIVNRTWANLLGRGIVEPIDDFRDSNPSVNDGLIEALAQDFVSSGFDFRHLVRTIMKSRTYQLSSRAEPLNKIDDRYFSHAMVRLIPAEPLADAISQVTGVPDVFGVVPHGNPGSEPWHPGYPPGTKAVQLTSSMSRTPFLKAFGRPDRNLACECEREKEPTLFQALMLISSRNIDEKLRSDSGRIAKLTASPKSNAEVLEELYLTALARPPSAKEKTRWLEHITKAGNRRPALEDLGWVLLNSKEFLFRH